ncbi:hypothetical protein EMIHUDRAFT_461091 [Emiliania huxleyi CCMP1516]|uniref:Fatty acid hydroxylase domain-containing protein n=2 Tax=Emiliania huxleyi TaxID=2903 RepID=A0A0D3L262_EMIH1|nr:hypothetical protein EMIHUDRAFT_461091 [Emiliania huxleyi CCMP1516]EOD42097.1 hypothetical protein EMIHUDRAFT_461091 [Emiliania huxleyi CCMP1516]|eukprot:XP_005794526.1 hypothetical protein EMIHUDRAFT_461091 [Emiliania huxleyi CCMP1516]
MLSTLIRGFAGATDGRFYRVSPSFVDSALPPGASVIPRPTFAAWLRAGPLVLINTPNTIWALIAVCMFECVPYDLSRTGPAASAPLSAAFFAARLPLWLGVWLGYTLWWHATLHWFGFAERPFVAAREYRPGRVAHNLVWSVSGVVIWTGFENVFAYLWATGRLAYVDETAWSSRRGALHFCAALLLVPLWRDVHFFFAHRMLHFNALYAQVHSLHHRNTDVEPFSGLCMHPVEHLYYFACALPSLLLLTTPFALLWNGVHLLLSPGASHSGFEDHWQADAYHYFHHRYVSCNYAGTDAGFLDVWFGSFVDTLKPTDQKGCKPRPDAKATRARTRAGPPPAAYRETRSPMRMRLGSARGGGGGRGSRCLRPVRAGDPHLPSASGDADSPSQPRVRGVPRAERRVRAGVGGGGERRRSGRARCRAATRSAFGRPRGLRPRRRSQRRDRHHALGRRGAEGRAAQDRAAAGLRHALLQRAGELGVLPRAAAAR